MSLGDFSKTTFISPVDLRDLDTDADIPVLERLVSSNVVDHYSFRLDQDEIHSTDPSFLSTVPFIIYHFESSESIFYVGSLYFLDFEGLFDLAKTDRFRKWLLLNIL